MRRISLMKNVIFLCQIVIISFVCGCKNDNLISYKLFKIRPLVDTIGFAHSRLQMHNFMTRIEESGWRNSWHSSPWRVAICPHDDYTYTGDIYPMLLQNIRARNLILIGVAHKAARLGIEDSLVFDSFSGWKGPWRDVEMSSAREELYKLLKSKCAIISDSLQRIEHSIESMIPFLQYFNRNIRIIPVLVPAMSPDRMNECGRELAEAIKKIAGRHGWKWGKDFAIIATTDAVHYGNEDWEGTDRAVYGCDSTGNARALETEHEIINDCLTGDLTTEKIKLFSSFTLDPDNFRIYKWTWCGRYSVPVALYTAFYLNNSHPLKGELVDYSTSITRIHVPVDDLGMGRTAIATPCHWVGYAAVGYK